MTYTYDNNGNLLTKTDANGSVTTVAAYDGLNRPVAASAGNPAITYTTGNSGNPTVATAPVYFTWDQDFKGALSSVCASSNGSGEPILSSNGWIRSMIDLCSSIG